MGKPTPIAGKSSATSSTPTLQVSALPQFALYPLLSCTPINSFFTILIKFAP